jgi:hypothetical protein
MTAAGSIALKMGVAFQGLSILAYCGCVLRVGRALCLPASEEILMHSYSWFYCHSVLRKIAITACALVLLAAFASVAQASGAKGAMLYANGDVAVNGLSVRNSIVVFVGDKIQVGDNSTAAILSESGMRFVSADSSFVLDKSGSHLNSSTAMSNQFVVEKDGDESKDKDKDKDCPHPSKRPGHDCGISKAKP